MMPDIQSWLPRLQGITYLLTLLLVLGMAVSHFVAGVDPLFRTLISCLPLLPLLPGLSRGNSQAHFYLCTLLLLYFLVYGSALVVPGQLYFDLLLLSLVIGAFVTAALAMQAAHQSRRSQIQSIDGENP